jgi:TRAP-type mannitol/chloroaromatic compound transport system permease small subunit|tara:strand:+ start:5956 stop:6471 length:516 start_codon:yes stop_codon:yes gene_type:complete
MNRIISAADGVSLFFGRIGDLLVLPLIGALVYEVLSRYLLGAPTAWAYEVSYMLMGTIFLLSLGSALVQRLHVNVDLVSGTMPNRLRAGIDFILYSAFLIVLIWISRQLFTTAVHAYVSGEVSGKSAWNPIIWPFQAIWFFGFAGLSLQVTAEIMRAARLLILGEENGVQS